jgi:LacI family transcriptional regulator
MSRAASARADEAFGPGDAMEKRVTLRMIAEVAGVHFTTAGLALRNDPRVKGATMAKVQAAARSLGYTRDAMLSALSTYRRTHLKPFPGVIAEITTFVPDELKTNVTARRLLEATRNCAQAQGFGLETFQINAPGMTGLQLSRILRARGIQGVVLSPRLPDAGPIPALEWENFSTVAVGYSITNLRLHRVCVHHAYNLRLCLHTLRARGYRRIGLVMQQSVFDRNYGLIPGTFYAEQCLLPESDRVAPLIEPETTKALLGKWLREQRIDCAILTDHPLEIQAWIKELGYDVPGDLGICLANRYGMTDGIAGIDEQLGLLGEMTVNILVSMLQHNERGLPVSPHYTLIEGSWVERPTVHPLTAVQAMPV